MNKTRLYILISVIVLALLLTGTALAAGPTQNSPNNGFIEQIEFNEESNVPAVEGGRIDAVATQYNFSSNSGTYTEIISGTVHGTASNDDQNFNAINLGFTFHFNNIDYTQISIQSNGWIAMGPTTTSSYTPLSTGTVNNIIAALGRDIQGNGTTSVLMSLVEGTAPDRVFTIQWSHYKRYGTSYVGDDFNFQIKLYETSGLVKVVYGPFTAVNNAAPPTIQVGLRGNSNADFNNRTTTTDWTASTAGTTNTDAMVLTDLIYPPSGLTYDWALATGLFLDPVAQSDSACIGSDIVYQAEVINQTGVAQSFNLTYTSIWPADGPASTGIIPNNGSETIEVSVHIPWAANVWDSDMLTVNAADASNTYTASATLTTLANMVSGYSDYSNVPVGREVRGAGVVYYDAKLYKIGGYGYVSGTGAARTWVDIYDIATDTWTSGADLPAARYWIDCEEIGGKIYCAGGYLTAGQNTLYIYDIASNTWSTGATLPANRYNYSSVKLNGKYYVIGGYTTAVNNAILSYDPVANVWDTTLPAMTTARRYSHAGVIGGKIYVAGGYSTTYLDSVEVFDPTVPSWTAGTTMPSAWLNAADGVLYDRYLVLTGGVWNSTSGASNGALIYDALLDQWNWLPLLNRILYGAEGDGDGTHFWTVSGRMYDGAWSNSPYTTLLNECATTCTPISGVDFTVDPPNPFPGLPATFSATAEVGSPPFDFDWDLGDGSISDGAVITHTYVSAGTYNVALTGTNCDGGSTAQVSHSVEVIASAQIVVDPTSLERALCADSTTTQELSICNVGVQPLEWVISESPSVLWLNASPLNGTVPAGLCTSVTVSYDSTGLTPGDYGTNLQIDNNDIMNPVVTVPVTLTVAGAPSDVAFTWNPLSPLLNEDVTFEGSATALMPVTYDWEFGDGGLGTGQNVTHSYSNWGTYVVSMEANQCGYTAVATNTLTVQSCWNITSENFEGTFPPANWSVVNNGGTCVWQRNDQVPSGRPNYAGGQGFAADADSDRCGSGTTMDTELRTMILDLSGTDVTTATVSYMTSYNDIGAGGDFADTDISLDGGTTWTNLLQWDSDHNASGPGELVTLDLTPYVGNDNVMLRYHYYLSTYDWWWEVDQVNVTACFVEGAQPDITVTPLELTQTLQANQTADQPVNITNNGLLPLIWTVDVGCSNPVGWLSASPTAGSLPAYANTDVTVTFDATSLPLGTYEAPICVNSNDPDSPTVTVAATLIVTGTPDISVTPLTLDAVQPPDVTTSQILQICDIGDGSLTWSLLEEQAGLASMYNKVSVGLPIDAISIPQPSANPAIGETGMSDGTPVIGAPANDIFPEDIGDAWEIMAPLPSARVFNAVVAAGPYVYVIGGTSDAGGLSPTNTNFRYNTAGNTWSTMAPMPAALDSIDGIAIGGMIYIPGSDPDNNTYVYDTATDTWSVIPANGGYAAPVQYQVVGIGNDLYVLGGIIGGASTPNVWILDTSAGTWSAGVPMLKTRTSFSAAAVGSNIYVAGGVAYPGFTPDMTAEMFNGSVWSYIASVPNGGGAYTRWSYNADGMAPGALWLAAGRRDAGWAVLNHSGFYDVATDSWTDSPTIPMLNQGRVYMEGDVASDGYFYVIGGRDSAGAIAYDTNERLMVFSPDVPWLSEDPISGTVLPGECTDVTVTFDSNGVMPGEYFANLLINSDDPDTPVVNVPVTLIVGSPTIVITPPTLDVQVYAGDTTTLPMSVTNAGTADLVWELFEGYPNPGWTENFDSYATGSQMHGQGGWKGWFNDPAAGAETSDTFARSAPNSVNIFGATDLVHEYSGSTDGTWAYSAWVYVPTTYTGQSDFILLNSYDDAGNNLNWSVQVQFDSATNEVLNLGLSGGELPLIKGAWVELRVVIDLDNNQQSFFYNGDLLYTATWTEEQGGGGGVLNIAAVDLFANSASEVYYDDLSLEQVLDIPWLSLNPMAGATLPGESSLVDVSFDSTGLSVGVYTATLYAQSNDPINPLLPIPVTMTVVKPDIEVTPLLLELTLLAGDTGTLPFTINNVGTGDLIWELTDDADWLSEEPTFGTIPAAGSTEVVATFDSTGLAPGEHTALILVSSNDPDEPVVTIDVTLTVVEPDIEVTPLSLGLTLMAGETGTLPFTINNVGTAVLTWDLTDNADWLSENPISGTIPSAGSIAVVVTFDATDLTPAVYTATIDVNSDDPDELIVPIAVTLTVVPVPVPDIDVFPLSLEKTLYVDETGSMTFTISNFGSAALMWDLTDSAAWLSEDPISSTIPAAGSIDVSVAFDASGLSPNVYTATINVNSNDVDEPVVTVDVVLTVVAVPVPDIVVTAPQLDMVLNPDTTGTLTFTIGNVGTVDLDWNLTDGANWLSELPASGTISPEGSSEVVVTFDSTGLIAGEYQASITITSNDPDESPISLDVTLTVNEIVPPGYQFYLPIIFKS